MGSFEGVLWCLAYILGLLATAIAPLPSRGDMSLQFSWQELIPLVSLVLAVVGLGIGTAIAIPRIVRTAPSPRSWLIAGFIAALAIVHIWYRQPIPAINDISQFINLPIEQTSPSTPTPQNNPVTVQGVVEDTPMLTRSHRARFWLAAQQLQIKPEETTEVTGRLYVTVPLLQATGIYPGDVVKVSGNLYQPKAAANPRGFDFRAFLARQGSFAGFSGKFVSLTSREFSDSPPWGWWQIRQKIARSQVFWLGSPAGELLSSMVLGSRAVDLPYEIKDQFVETGLAHVLAASGFHVSLLLGVLLFLTKKYAGKIQFMAGLLGILIFISLAGWQPSVARAGIMGFGVLLGILLDRKTKPLGSLLLAATLLLVTNPLWIWDLGFQLSFLATLGLVTTVEPITKRLDWLPTLISSLVAVPLAASLWTLPLLLHVFSVFSTYSIFVNILSTPLVTVISLGGMASAVAAVIYPIAGSSIAYALNLPIWTLIKLVEFFSNVPGNSIAIGSISLGQMLLVYGIIILIWLFPKIHRYWWLMGLGAIAMILIPNWYWQKQLFQATLLATPKEQVFILQNQGKIGLINASSSNTRDFTLVPFLRQQGINSLDTLINLAPNSPSLPQTAKAVYQLDKDNKQVIQTTTQPSLDIKETIDFAGLNLKILNPQIPII
ncbi:MAG: ComEC family competence protein, partial [Coleofasciculaceae cyanobacterium SM2_1_6]|nr:ComEC family competence protein [Coleofasciculaceae cyanobacterium SM2_1_6]